jgi:hypothetical protein
MLFKKLIWISGTRSEEQIKVGKPFIIPWVPMRSGSLAGRHPRNNKWLPYLDHILLRLGYPVYLLKLHYQAPTRRRAFVPLLPYNLLNAVEAEVPRIVPYRVFLA